MNKSDLKIKESLTWNMNYLKNWIVKEAAKTNEPASVFPLMEVLRMVSFVHATNERHFCISDDRITELIDLDKLTKEDLQTPGRHYIIAVHDVQHVILELLEV